MTQRSRKSFLRRSTLLWKVLDRRWGIERKLAFAVVLAALISGVVTVFSWTGAADFGPDPNTVIVLLYLDSVLLLLLGQSLSASSCASGRSVAAVWPAPARMSGSSFCSASWRSRRRSSSRYSRRCS